MIWTHVRTLALLALFGFDTPASAQAQCPELTRLLFKVADASYQTRGGPIPTSGLCASYVRLTMAWDDVIKYVKEHREWCDVSTVSPNVLEKNHDEAVKARNNVCAGLPARRFPTELILR